MAKKKQKAGRVMSAEMVAFEGLGVTVDCVVREAAQLAAKIQPVLMVPGPAARPEMYATVSLEKGASATVKRVNKVQGILASLANELADLKERVQL